jgi:hypothetical protein
MQNPVIVIPGIQGSALEDFYPMPSEALWSAVVTKEYERLALHPDNTRYEAQEPARVLPAGPLAIAYKDLVEALRHELSEKRDRPTPVFPFAYDWRHDVQRTADLLDGFIDEVLARTWLLPHYRKEADRRVDLVGHSMGGLVMADYVSRYGGKKVRRCVSLATPFQGSVEAIKKVTTGSGSFTGDPPRDREREMARSIPAVYQLLPKYKGAVTTSEAASVDLLDINTWQPSILRSIKESIRLQNAVIDAETLFKSYLASSGNLTKSINALKQGKLPVEWMAVVGTGSKTQMSTNIVLWSKSGPKQPWFEFPAAMDEAASERTGDGTVPFPGACPPFLPKEQLVCVSPDDFSFWELKDRSLAKLAGFHSMIPAMNLAQRLTIKFLKPAFSGDVWAHPAPGVETPDWPIKMTL